MEICTRNGREKSGVPSSYALLKHSCVQSDIGCSLFPPDTRTVNFFSSSLQFTKVQGETIFSKRHRLENCLTVNSVRFRDNKNCMIFCIKV